ncbi:MAG: AraC family transcriptional regulator [Candidatus Cloacimonadota bacterium]|nr:MAG: AraC family transcriptional regulator [Candidatus Cloacimonadota bacterium]PIE77865.1 MAG: AraC family transcriptional regulator [Candidatus Delongbacteria bacterium]
MNQLANFNRTLEYLEKCLDDKVDEKKVLSISGYSYPLFSKVFSIISGITLSDYLRSRKLTKAALDIANSNEKIIVIAMKYGYDSHNSFTTAFKNFHNVTPSEVRKGYKYKIFSPVHFSLNIEGGNKMDVKIERKKEFAIAGISVDAKNSMDFPKLWQELMTSKGADFLSGIGDGQDYGACFNAKSERDFSYMAGFDVNNRELAISNGLEILEIPETDYAIIPLKGKVPDCIHKGWEYVMGTFFPENGLKHAGTPDLEVYGKGDMNSDEYEMELWVPVEKE